METLVYWLLIIVLSTMLLLKTLDIVILLWLQHEHKKGNLDKILKDIENVSSQEQNENTIIMVLNENEDGYFAYDDSNRFLANGKTISELEKRFAERFPGIMAKIVDKRSDEIFFAAQLEERKNQILKLMKDNNLKTPDDVIAFVKKLDKDS